MLDPFTGEPTAAKVPVGQIAVGVMVGDEETLDLQVRNARPVDATMDDDGTEQSDHQDDTGAPADRPEGGEGDVAGSAGAADGGSARTR